MTSTKELLITAKNTVKLLSKFGDEDINKALNRMADELVLSTEEILRENARDIEAARDKISPVMIDRLTLNEKRIADMAKGIREITALPSPLGIVLSSVDRPNGLKIDKVSVPMGVIAIIYESRPNVTSDAAALALKSGNVCVLRGGKEAYLSAVAIVTALK